MTGGAMQQRSLEMPIYEYQCEKCGNEFESLVFGNEKPACPACESRQVTRLMSCCGFVSKSAGGQTVSSSAGSSCGGCSASSCARLRSLMASPIRIGTRGSQLALWQAQWVQQAIKRMQPDAMVELVIIKTQGDKILDVPLAKVGGKGLFVKEIEEALLDGRIDLAVHSMKDMPAELPAGLIIGAVPQRENPLDALITNTFKSLEDLPSGCPGRHQQPASQRPTAAPASRIWSSFRCGETWTPV